jgi:hypothetical protein
MTLSHTIWAGQIAAFTDLPDERLDKRLAAILLDTLESRGYRTTLGNLG